MRAFLTSLRKDLPHRDLFSSEESRFIDEICRSVTFHFDENALHGLLPYQMDAFALFMYTFRFQPYWLPALRHVSVQYTDWEYDNILDQMRCESIPHQVTHFSVDYAFSDPALAAASESATTQRWFDGDGPKPVRHCPSIRCLSLAGMPPAFMAVMLHECLNIETLEIAHPVQLGAHAPPRPPVRTLVLCHPGVAISTTTMASWALDAALEAGLFGEGTKRPPIVVQGIPDPVAFTRWKQTYKGFDVDLVYERDDCRRRGC